MYIPPQFAMENPTEIVGFMKQYNFAIMISAVSLPTSEKLHKPIATHLPFLISYENDNLVLSAHLSAENLQAQFIDNQQLLVVFSEPHAYISPTVYQNFPNVPTWNYVAIHAYGTGKILGREDTIKLMEKSVAHFEPQNKTKFWDNLPPQYLNTLLDEIVAFEINIETVEGQKKLSQHKSKQDQQNIREMLAKSVHSHERELGKLMDN
jgi:transcriptional regulator